MLIAFKEIVKVSRKPINRIKEYEFKIIQPNQLYVSRFNFWIPHRENPNNSFSIGKFITQNTHRKLREWFVDPLIQIVQSYALLAKDLPRDLAHTKRQCARETFVIQPKLQSKPKTNLYLFYLFSHFFLDKTKFLKRYRT